MSLLISGGTQCILWLNSEIPKSPPFYINVLYCNCIDCKHRKPLTLKSQKLCFPLCDPSTPHLLSPRCQGGLFGHPMHRGVLPLRLHMGLTVGSHGLHSGVTWASQRGQTHGPRSGVGKAMFDQQKETVLRIQSPALRPCGVVGPLMGPF